ncbi:MAG: sigma-70 family RNA polymerase sigma factor [Verrucomicrobiota bacterium]
MTDSQTLLVDYVNSGSEGAFRELVARYLDLVYSSAVRLLGGDTALAEDVAQTVFVDLARLAKSLSSEVRLGGWLHRHTCFVAAKTQRGERRRQFRERQAVEMNVQTDHSEARLAKVAPILDEAINQLGATDRAAVLLRFYERLDFRSVGQALGINEAAAQKRVARALEKLHTLLNRRGVALSVTALGAALACEAVTAAPAELAASIAGTAVASAAAGTGNTLTILKFMAASKLKDGGIAAVILASVVAPFLVQHQAQARLNEQDQTWRRQTNQLAQLTADNQRLTGLLAQPKNPQSLPDDQFRELLKLRDEVGRLKNKVQEMTSAKSTTPLSAEDQLASMRTMYAARVDRLKQWLETNPSEKIPELQNLRDEIWINAVASQLDTEDDLARAARILRANAQEQVFDILWAALRKYAPDNNGQFPTDLSQLKPYFKSPIDDAILQRYQILPASSLVPELQPGGDWVITQAAPVNPALDLREACGLTGMRMADERVTNRWNLLRLSSSALKIP